MGACECFEFTTRSSLGEQRGDDHGSGVGAGIGGDSATGPGLGFGAGGVLLLEWRFRVWHLHVGPLRSIEVALVGRIGRTAAGAWREPGRCPWHSVI